MSALALSNMSSRTSTMPLLWLLYTVGSGAPSWASVASSAASSSVSAVCRACSSAISLCLSFWEKAAASTTVSRDCSSALKLLLSTCTRAGFFAISRSRMAMARSITSMASISSASAASKSAFSLSRMRVAFFNSSSASAMPPARPSISLVEASMQASASQLCLRLLDLRLQRLDVERPVLGHVVAPLDVLLVGLQLGLALTDDLRRERVDELDDLGQRVGVGGFARSRGRRGAGQDGQGEEGTPESKALLHCVSRFRREVPGSTAYCGSCVY